MYLSINDTAYDNSLAQGHLFMRHNVNLWSILINLKLLSLSPDGFLTNNENFFSELETKAFD